MQVLKILSRRKDNRVQFGQQGIQTVLTHISSIVSKSSAAEAANIILNVCYERPSVALVVQCGGVATLVQCLSDSHADLQANAAGAIQSICFQVCRLMSRQPQYMRSSLHAAMSIARPLAHSTCFLPGFVPHADTVTSSSHSRTHLAVQPLAIWQQVSSHEDALCIQFQPLLATWTCLTGARATSSRRR